MTARNDPPGIRVMAWLTSSSVCLPLLLVLSAVGTCLGADLSQLCVRRNMPYQQMLNLNAIQGEWYLHTMTMDLNLLAYKLNITRTASLWNTMHFLNIEAKAAVNKTTGADCMSVTSLNTVGFSSYSTNKWVIETSGTFYVYFTNFYILATDYTTTMVLMTEPVVHGIYGMANNHVDIYVRNSSNSPDTHVVNIAVSFCNSALANVNSTYYTKIPYTNVPMCF